ncbi:tyrosine-type recombinase/integrase [candidate division WWE3 bacterium]|nr:tyrosine-type recombinase/integrase [candidate division WWE3 bacterium]
MPLSAHKALSSVITDFIEYCEIERGLSPATAMKYDYRLGRFILWAQEFLKKKPLELADVDIDLIRKFRVFLSRQDLKESTRYNYLVTIRAFLKFLVKTDYESVKPEKIELGKYSPGRSLKFLKPEQLDELLSQPNVKTISGTRDRAILELLFSTGLRVSEMAFLNRDMVDLKSKEFTVVGKGRRRRVVFLSDSAVEWISHYLELRKDTYHPLFLSYSGPNKHVIEPENDTRAYKGSKSDGNQSGNINSHLEKASADELDPDGERFRLSVRSIQRLVKKYTKKAALPVDVTPHVLRHTFATDLLMGGADLRTVQESLGHKNVSTTQIYTHITNTQLKRAHEAFHGKWRKENK